MVIESTKKEISTQTKDFSEVINPSAQPKKSSPFSKWNWSQMTKYGAVGSLAVLGFSVAYSQLWATAGKIPEAVRTVYETTKNGSAGFVKTVNDGIEVSKRGYYGLGLGISWIRSVASKVVETPPVPETTEAVTALGLEYVGNAWLATSIAATNAIIVAPLLYLIKPLTGLPGRKFAVSSLSLLGAQTAVPGFMGIVLDSASSMWASSKRIANSTIDKLWKGSVAVKEVVEEIADHPSMGAIILTGVYGLGLSLRSRVIHISSIVLATSYCGFLATKYN